MQVAFYSRLIFLFSQTVPGNLTRYGLSQIINHLLNLDPHRPFDFLIQDELLRLSIHKHMAAKQLTTEAVLEVEYVPAVLPPTPKEQHPHDDWISAIAVLPAGDTWSKSNKSQLSVTVAGCYDGVVRLWEGDSSAASFAAHKGAVKAAAVVASNTNAPLLITGGDDCCARVWSWPSSNSASSSVPELQAVLTGHTASVQAVAVSPEGDRCVTGGWDGQILMYRCGTELAAAVAEAEEGQGAQEKKKKRRTGGKDAGKSVPTDAYEETPLSSLGSYSQCISALSWSSQSTLVSACWDHAVRVFDPEVSAVLDTFSHNKAVHCVATPAGGDASVIAFGGPEKSLRVWDRREGQNEGETIAVRGLSSHTDWISGLAWHPTSEHHVLSVSYDQTAKLWDLRAAVPLHTLPAVGEKLLTCAWVSETEVAYGGADCVLRTAHVELGLGAKGGAL